MICISLPRILSAGGANGTSGLLVLENVHLLLCGCTFPGEGEGEGEGGLSRRTDRDNRAAGWEQPRSEAAPLRSRRLPAALAGRYLSARGSLLVGADLALAAAPCCNSADVRSPRTHRL